MNEAQVKIDAFDTKIIYVYKHLDVVSHRGWLKVGETSRSRITGTGKNVRITEQNSAANIAYEVLYTTNAVTNSGIIFSDKDIHKLLESQDIEREETTNPGTNKVSEWFKTDLQTIIDTIERYKLEAIENEEGILKDFTLRKEQREAVEKTKEYYENAQNDINVEPDFLWNAKPRFGKTLTAYCFAAEIKAQKVLIVTNRPAIADSWFTDFKKFDFKNENQEDGKHRWIFTSSEPVKNRLGNPRDIFTREEQLSNNDLLAKPFVHFISLQDIKGQGIDGFKDRNRWIFDIGADSPNHQWDIVIIDESHEAVDTEKAFRVLKNVHHKFALHLSGTPFKALASNKFNGNQIYNWSYTDEQEAKQNWVIADGENPYAELPQMNIFTYQLSRALEVTAEDARNEGSEYAFDLGEFFRAVKVEDENGKKVDRFAYEDKVKLFIRNLRDENFEYPFSSSEYRENIRHTFWLLPGIKACNLMKEILLADEYFSQNYDKKDIIVAAGNGDEDAITKTALEEVRLRINGANNSKHPLETRTITLSCGQLTTGVTIPAWTAVLMLNNCKSPALYMQTAFRVQNPFSITTSGGEVSMKTNCFVFDFAPDRILQTLAEMADSGVSDTPTRTREEKVKILTNFLPVIAEDDEGKMKYLNANEILTIPLKLITEEVISRGFMSNRLFDNISGIFGCPQSIKDIISKMDEAKDNGKVNTKNKPKITNKSRIWIDADKKIHINEDIVVATTNGLLGDKKYVEISSEEGKEVADIMAEAISQAKANGYENSAINEVAKTLKKKLPELVVKLPEPEPQKGEEGYFDKEDLDEKPASNEKTDEEKVRDRLRGFARTIPTFLIAYGSADTKLNNFGDNIPDDIFLELTNITKDEFRQLRDGMDYEFTDEKTGETKTAHFNGLFNEVVFNSSVAEFAKKRVELAAYYNTDSKEDIFEYIPPQANNQIFTPKRVVKMMIDVLEKNDPEIFANAENTFIDLYMKSGMYITEIVRRIFAKTHKQYDSDLACVKHILEHQVYGLAPSPILDAITKNYIFGFDELNEISTDNFQQLDATPFAKEGTLEAKLNELFTEGGNMKFTAVVGNPPYMGDNHLQIYTDFYLSARKLSEYVNLIFPIGWQEPKTANNLGKLNSKGIKEDPQIIQIDNRQNVFPGIPGAEWTNIILWKRGYDNGLNGKQKILTNGTNEKIIKLATEKSEIKKPEEIVMFAKLIVERADFSPVQKITSVRKPYGLSTDVIKDPSKYHLPEIHYQKKQNDTDITLYTASSKYYLDERYPLPKRTKAFEKYKVFVPYAWGNMSENAGLGGAYSDVIIALPNEAAIETYQESGCFNDLVMAKKHAKYLMTKFARALLYRNKHSQHSTTSWGAVPVQDYSEPWWDKSIAEIDRELIKKYNVPQRIADYIDKNIQTKTTANIINYEE